MKKLPSVRFLGGLLLAGLVTTSVARAEEESTTSTIKLSSATKPSSLRVDMSWADIHIVGADTDTVTVESTLPRKDAKPKKTGGLRRLDNDVSFELIEHDNAVTLRLAGDNAWAGQGAEFKISIPRAMALDIRTNAGGDLGVKDVDGDIEVNNLNGSVRLEGISGSTVINTMNGEVRAFYAKVPAKLVSITSMNGQVDLQIPSDTKANIRLRTHNGSILTDFGEDVLKTKTEGKGTSYHYSYSGDGARDIARGAADAAHAAAKMAQDIAMEVQRTIAENDDDDDKEDASDADDAPTATVKSDSSGNSTELRAPRPPRPPRAPRAPRAPVPPVPPITGGKLVSGTLNGGGGIDIKISTMNGEIKLRETK